MCLGDSMGGVVVDCFGFCGGFVEFVVGCYL